MVTTASLLILIGKTEIKILIIGKVKINLRNGENASYTKFFSIFIFSEACFPMVINSLPKTNSLPGTNSKYS